MEYRINRQNCLGINRCGICLRNYPEAVREGIDGKSEIIDQERLNQCGGEKICPRGAIEVIDQESKQTDEIKRRAVSQFVPGQGRKFDQGRGLAMGRGRGIGAGRGRGLGIGPRDGRGGGRGGGGRRG